MVCFGQTPHKNKITFGINSHRVFFLCNSDFCFYSTVLKLERTATRDDQRPLIVVLVPDGKRAGLWCPATVLGRGERCPVPPFAKAAEQSRALLLGVERRFLVLTGWLLWAYFFYVQENYSGGGKGDFGKNLRNDLFSWVETLLIAYMLQRFSISAVM